MILKILQVIGIVLLSVLGLILLLVILALVLPVCYELSCKAEEGCRPVGVFKASYFLGLFRARADYTDALYVKVKILFFTLFQMKIPDKDEDSDEEYDLNELDDMLEAMDEEETGSSDEVSKPEEDIASDAEDAATDMEYSDTEEPDPGEESEEVSDDEADANLEEEMSEDSEDSAFSKLRLKYDEICDKIKRVRSEIRYYRNLYNSNEAKEAIFLIRKKLKHVLKKVFPRRVHANLVFGFDSPDITGKVFGIYTLFAKRFDRSSRVRPDFERKIFEGTVFCKGHFNIWCLLMDALTVILNKNVRKIYRSYKHHNKMKENKEGTLDKAA